MLVVMEEYGLEASIRKLMEEAEEYLGKRNYSKAAYKYLEIAKVFEKEGKLKDAEHYFRLAVDNFIVAANEARQTKSFRKAAENSLMALEVYEKLNILDKKDSLILDIASDLANAANEYLMWKDVRGAATCVVLSSLIYFATGKVDDAKNIIESFKAKISAEDFEATRILSVASLIQKVVTSSDVSKYSEIEGLVNSRLKPMLPLIKGNVFLKLVDEAVQAIRKKVRKEVKLPKIVPMLRIPSDLTFGQPFDINLKLKNTGEGEARNIKILFNLPEKVKILKGETKVKIDTLPADNDADLKLTLSISDEGLEEKEYSIGANLEYSDALGTVYSTIVGPVNIILRTTREREKLKDHLKNSKEKLIHLEKKLEKLPEFLKYVFLRMIKDIKELLNETELLLRDEKINEAKINIKTVGFIFNEIEQLLMDKKLEEKIKAWKEELIQKQAKEIAKEEERGKNIESSEV